MKRETVKALLENGILQAYAEGKEVEYKHCKNEWKPAEELAFSDSPENYRIKPTPQFKVGDLVRDNDYSTGIITAITTSHEAYVELSGKDGLKHLYPLRELTPIREVRTPLTFEQAVKLVAEKGFTLTNGASYFDILCLGRLVMTLLCRETEETNTERYECFCNSLTFPDNTPFANVTYEDIT
jgi:hypothetical protein